MPVWGEDRIRGTSVQLPWGKDCVLRKQRIKGHEVVVDYPLPGRTGKAGGHANIARPEK